MSEMSARDKLESMIKNDGVTITTRNNPNTGEVQYIGYVDGNEVERANTITGLVTTLWRMFTR